MNMPDIRYMMVRPPVPGEVWTFNAMEAHCIFMATNVIKEFAPEEDSFFATWNSTFSNMQKEYDLKEVRGTLPISLTASPLSEDRAFLRSCSSY